MSGNKTSNTNITEKSGITTFFSGAEKGKTKTAVITGKAKSFRYSDSFSEGIWGLIFLKLNCNLNRYFIITIVHFQGYQVNR